MSKRKTEKFVKFWKQPIEDEMMYRVDSLNGPKILKKAVSYALFSGGKRVRPLFYLAVLQSIEGLDLTWDERLNYGPLPRACSFEFFHAFTLVQDDLPCMDNDALRRGKPSLWKKFGESTALLASNVLLGMSYGSVAKNFAITEMLMPDSIIGGQAFDLGLEEGVVQEEINYMKTAHFFEKIVRTAIFDFLHADWSELELKQDPKDLVKFAGRFGAYFQHRDDFFDSKNETKKNESRKKMKEAIEDQDRLLKKMDLEDSVLGGFASWLIDKE